MGPVVEQAESVLRLAQRASGLAAYAHFFEGGPGDTRAVYLAAMEAEAEAEALVGVLRAVEAGAPRGACS